MGEKSPRVSGFSAGLAVILNGEDNKKISPKTRLLSCCDDLGQQSVERTLEYVFGLPNRSLNPLTCPIDHSVIRSVIGNDFLRFNAKLGDSFNERHGICFSENGSGPDAVGLEESSICGDIKIMKPPFLIESLAMFSSARANACVWKGKWMYEVTLETAGIQQLGWATLYCPFTDHKGVGDADDSYAYDGRRVSKWNKDAETYGQSWVVGDVIGCCIDLDHDEILFYRNGNSLGLAFQGIRKMGPGVGYYPAISLSQGERCELNFGARPFKYPIEGYLPLQAPPPKSYFVTQLLQCWSTLLDMHSVERAEHSLVQKLRRVKRFVSLEEIFLPASHAICEELFSVLEADVGNTEYMVWGPLLSFMFEVFGLHAPHDYSSLDKVVEVLLQFQGSHMLFEHLINALSCGCKIASLVLTECPYSGSYSYLALACHLLRREELMVLWWKSPDFEFLFEGFLSQKTPNKQDLDSMIPTVWWPGSCEDASYEGNMMLTTTALSESISKIEEKQRDLCRLVIQFIPPTTPPQLPGAVFRTFLQRLLLKNRGAERNVPPPGVSRNSVLVSVYTVILHFLSEGFALGNICGWLKSCKADVGFLHRGGQQSFPVHLFLKNDPHRTDISRLGGSYTHLSKLHPATDLEMEVVLWDEGCMDHEETRVTHSTRLKPCCCSYYDSDFTRNLKGPAKHVAKGSQGHCSSIPERPSHIAAECSDRSLNDEITDKPSSSDQSEPDYGYCQVRHMKSVPKDSNVSTAMLREEELLDALLWLYHVGLAPNFKQASYYMTHQAQSISLLEETDKQMTEIKEQACSEQLKRLKEARNEYREEVIDCLRHCAWYRISLFPQWKQRGMYAMCMWVVQLLLVLSNMDSLFSYIPEYYLEALVDCFHVLRKSDPPFVRSTVFIKQGLASFVTFVVTHFNDPRISSADLRDLLLHSISVLVQYKEYLAAFESNEAATQRLPKALLSAFDNRSWIPVTNILLRLCKGSGFSFSKNGESSSSSILFQRLLKEACIDDEGLFSAFLNRLFNTLSWTMTEFSVSVREMQEKYQVIEFQQRKCCVIFDLSCNLARILEFCTHEIPQAFLSGPDTNLRRLTELIVFILNHITSSADAEFFDTSLRRHSQSSEKVNRGMILAPLVGIILNLLDATYLAECRENNDLLDVFASMDCPDTVHCGFQYLLDYNWGEAYVAKHEQLDNFLSLLTCRTVTQHEKEESMGNTDLDDSLCCICYACEADARIAPCSHRSCYGCITRHLLNCQRCFFCNTTVTDVVRTGEKTG